jgi:transposase
MNLFSKQRGNVKVDNSRFPDAIIYICENGCKWRALPGTFGPWHTVCVRINRRVKNACWNGFSSSRKEQITNRRITVVSLDSSPARVHPDGTGALKKRRTCFREVPRRPEYKNTYDGGRQPVCHRVYFVRWGGFRRK